VAVIVNGGGVLLVSSVRLLSARILFLFWLSNMLQSYFPFDVRLGCFFRGFEFVPVAAILTEKRRHGESCASKRAFNGTDWRHWGFAFFASRYWFKGGCVHAITPNASRSSFRLCLNSMILFRAVEISL